MAAVSSTTVQDVQDLASWTLDPSAGGLGRHHWEARHDPRPARQPDERGALLAIGHPYYTTGASEDRIVVVINEDTDGDEIAELLTDSYRMLAPKKLIAPPQWHAEAGLPGAR